MIEVIALGIALAMDSLAVSIVNGIKYKNYDMKQKLISSFSFGIFQGLMPLLGYLVFMPFINYVSKIDHWLVFIILATLGINMIKEAIHNEDINHKSELFNYKTLLLESIATSIDALSVGVTLPSLALNPYLSCFIIFLATFIICVVGHCFGEKLGLLLKDKAMMLGGSVLILLGIKTLLEHLGVF